MSSKKKTSKKKVNKKLKRPIVPEENKVVVKLSRSALKKMTKRPGWEVSSDLKSLSIREDGSVMIQMKKEK